MTVKRLGAVACAALLAGACNLFNQNSDSSTSPSTTPKTETFSGTLAAQGASPFSFTTAQTGTVSVTLVSVGTSSSVAVGLGIGTPNGNACALTTSTPSATAGSAPQLSVTESAGAYCVQVYDVGNITTVTTFTITVVHS
jgi:hypothetical protein